MMPFGCSLEAVVLVLYISKLDIETASLMSTDHN